MVNAEIDTLAKKIWNYHLLHHSLKPADILFVLCSHDLRVADYAAELFHKGFAPWLVFSGGIAHKGDLVETPWDEPEAMVFARRAKELKVPDSVILTEVQSTNCGENVQFTKNLLIQKKISVSTIIAVQKPYMERRTFATLKKHWPEKQIVVTSPPILYEEYPTTEISLEDVIHIMVGDLQRIKIYADKGYQISQEIPADVWQAYERLVKLGYTKHLIKDNH